MTYKFTLSKFEKTNIAAVHFLYSYSGIAMHSNDWIKGIYPLFGNLIKGPNSIFVLTLINLLQIEVLSVKSKSSECGHPTNSGFFYLKFIFSKKNSLVLVSIKKL